MFAELLYLNHDIAFPSLTLTKAENEAGPGESLHQMQSGLLQGIHDRAPEHLAVDRHLLVRKHREKRLREHRHGNRQLLRINALNRSENASWLGGRL